MTQPNLPEGEKSKEEMIQFYLDDWAKSNKPGWIARAMQAYADQEVRKALKEPEERIRRMGLNLKDYKNNVEQDNIKEIQQLKERNMLGDIGMNALKSEIAALKAKQEYTKEHLISFAEWCDCHEGSMDNLLNQWLKQRINK